MKWLMATIVAILLVLPIVVAALFDIPLILCYIVIGGGGVFLFIKWLNSGEPVERFISYDYETDTAIVTKRVPSNGWDIKVKQYIKRYTKYTPSKTIYTGATVGGITTGGFHQTQATLSSVGAGGSGGYYLEAKVPKKDDILENEYLILESIRLSADLVAEAKKDKRVCHLLQGNELVLRRKNKDTELTPDEKEILKQAILTRDIATQENITERAFAAQFLSAEECHNVLEWLCGDNTEETVQSDKAKDNTNQPTVSNVNQKRKHPSHCVHRDKKTHCNCRLSKKYHKACSSTSGCRFYKERKS